MLSSISIQGFKAITEKLELNNLAPINYLIGPNGSGKSSVLEGIRFLLPSNKSPLFNSDYDAVAFDNIIPKLFGYKNFKDFDINMKDIFKNDFRFNFSIDNIQFEFTLPDKWYEYGIHVMEVNNKPVLTKDFGLKHIELISINILNQDVYSYLSNSISIESNMIDFQHMIEKGVKLNQAPTVIGLREIFGINFATIGLKSERKLIIQERFGSDYDIIDINKVASGYKVLFILLDLLNRKDSKAKDVCVLIEEPEIGLHPKFQKLFPILIQNFINEHSKYTSLQFFISTHSPFIINSALELDRERYESLSDEDKKSFKPTHKVYHLEGGTCKNPEGISATDFSISGFDGILSSIGVQPSDLLFANGVIWVEGPSDAIYIEKWLEMYALSIEKKIYKPGFDFQFQMYGGTILKFYTDRETTNQEKRRKLTDIFKINTRAFMVMDSDINSNGVDKSTYKKEKELILSEFNSISSDKVGIWHDTCVSTIECYTPNYEYHDWWKNHHNQNHWSEYKNKDWKNEYAYRLVNLWSKKLKSEKGEIWDQYLKTLSNEAKTGLEKYIKSLYATIQSWNEPK
jgi:predicted ATPase